MELRIFFFGILLFAGQAFGRVKPVDLQVNNKTEPLGLTMEHIRFAWTLQASGRGVIQEAWQIQVAGTEADLKREGALLWDSGKTPSDRQYDIAYKGNDLISGQRYFWRVRIWSHDGEASQWSEVSSFVTGVLSDREWSASKWIAYEELPQELRVVPGVHGGGDRLGERAVKRAVVPLFRKSFTLEKPVAEAYLFISGLGHYEAYLNGVKAGDDFLAPGWTAYDKRSLYNTYDVTSQLQRGENVLGAIVGPGFRYINRERYRKLVRAEAYPMLRAKLLIRFADGDTETVDTDGTWFTDPSPITFSSIYGGEDYDANREQEGWNRPGFDAGRWKPAALVRAAQGAMAPETAHPLKVMEAFRPQEIKTVGQDSFMYDFGQNASGIIRLEAQGQQGDTVRIFPAEVLDDEGLPTQRASGSPYYLEYVLKGGKKESWQPAFTYYGFRYALVIIKSAKMTARRGLQLTMLHTRNSAPEVGTFACGNPLFNQINELIRWGIKSNLASVATDCPHREKLGWLEQTHLIGASLRYNFDIRNLYGKIVDDMMESQLENGLVPDIVPEYVPFEDGFRDSPEWGSAAIIIPWYLYQWYGDSAVLDRAYPMMTRYLAYLGTKADGHLLSHGLGDWFDLGPENPGVSQLTPIGVTASATYFYDAKLMGQIAAKLGYEADSRRYNALADSIRSAFNARYFDKKTAVYATGSQTSFAMPLYMGMVEERMRDKVERNLMDSILANDRALTAGDVGYRYLLRALEQAGASQLIYEMNNRDDVPGYGYQIRNGATALTESWAALKYVSNNHMMLGHLMEWLYSGLLGIQADPGQVAFKSIVIKPAMVEGMKNASGSYQSPYGKIAVAWEKKPKGKVVLQVQVPPNTTATVFIPNPSGNGIKENGVSVEEHPDIEMAGQQDGLTVLRIGSGQYSFRTE